MYIFNSLLYFDKYWYQGFFSFKKGRFVQIMDILIVI